MYNTQDTRINASNFLLFQQEQQHFSIFTFCYFSSTLTL